MAKLPKSDSRSRYVTSAMSGERVQAFVPAPLPPDAGTLDVASLQGILAEANQAVGRLDGMTSAFPNLNLFLYSYVRKEAVLSSQIEGTQSSLSDLLLYENAEIPGVPLDDVQEVSNYVAALNHGLKRLRGGFPLPLRLIREIQEVLLATGRGSHAQPGEFRKSQNWIGGSRPGNAAYVPPPPEYVMDCLGDFESFLHKEENSLPLLIRAGLVHAQFETIHPFLDGNGRVGRLLITFMLTEKRMLLDTTLCRRSRQRYAASDRNSGLSICPDAIHGLTAGQYTMGPPLGRATRCSRKGRARVAKGFATLPFHAPQLRSGRSMRWLRGSAGRSACR